MIIITDVSTQDKPNLTEPVSVRFLARANEGIYSLLGVNPYSPNVPGVVLVCESIDNTKISDVGNKNDRIRVLIDKKALKSNKKNKKHSGVRGYVLGKDGWVRDEVMVVPVKKQLYSRLDGLIETDKLSNKKVVIAGQGSGGSPISVGFVQSGVENLFLIDHDRMCVGNIMRHVLGLDTIGRLKTLAMAEYLSNKNPNLDIRTSEVKICMDNIELWRFAIREADLVIGATGDRESKRVLNKLCYQENKVLIIAGAFRRAYGGNVLRVRPGESLCYQCMLQWFKGSQDEEISNAQQAEGLAYTDRPVPIEPGLATDIHPISTMVVKLGIQELLKGTETTLQPLDDDLSAPFFLFYNRREKKTPSEKFNPLGVNIDGMHVLRWYGVNISRYPTCEECSEDGLAQRHNITVTEKDMEFFDVEIKNE